MNMRARTRLQRARIADREQREAQGVHYQASHRQGKHVRQDRPSPDARGRKALYKAR